MKNYLHLKSAVFLNAQNFKKKKSNLCFVFFFTLLFSLFGFVQNATSQTTLAAGDLAIIGFNTNTTPDNLVILVLKDLSAGTVFYVNDNEVTTLGGSTFADLNEALASFTVKAGQTVAKGTVLVLPWNGLLTSTTAYDWNVTAGAGLGNGEEIYVYTASSITATTPTAFIYGVTQGANTGLRPNGLTDGTTWIDHGTARAYRYNTTGSIYSGTQALLLAAIGNTANHTGAATYTFSSSDWTFTIGSAANPTVNLSVSTNSGTEAGTTAITVTATASSSVSADQTVALGVSGTDITTGDFSLSNSTITILSGQTTGSVTFTVTDDALVESTETAVLTISSPSAGITLGTPTSQNITITDNDVSANPTVALSVNSNTGSEAGTTLITITATASSAVSGDQTVSLGVSGTDITVGDYSLSNSTITILNGQTTGSVTFTVTDDALVESTETAVLTISSPSAGITLGTPTSQNITITDNDVSTVTTLAAGDISVIGYNLSGTPNDNFAILVQKDLSAGTVFYINDNEIATTGGSTFTDINEVEISLTVKAGQNIPKGTVIIIPWGVAAVSTSTYDLTSSIGGGLGSTGDEIYIYNAASITSTTATSFICFAKIGNSPSAVPSGLISGTTSINPSLVPGSRYKISGALYNACQADLLAAIGNTATNWEAVAPGAAGDWTFTVLTTCAPVLPTVTLSVNSTTGSEAGTTAITVIATASSAVTGDQTLALGVSGTDITTGDYSLSNSTITILNGQTTGSVTFTVVDDAVVETTETATLTISSPSAGIILGTTTTQNIAITDNDVAPNPTVSLSVSANAGSEAGTTAITVTAIASSVVSGDQTVALGVSGTNITAGDYSLSNSTITILNGQTTGSVTFTIADDQLVEGAETAILTISSPSLGITLLGTITQNILITDNDIATTVAFLNTNSTALESAGIAKVFLQVTVTGNVPGSINLDPSVYSTATGGGVDYTVPVTLSIPANLTVGTQVSFDFTINDDATVEADEYVICKTTGASNVTIASTAQSTLYIRDNDTQTPVASNQLALSFVSSFSNGASGTNSAEISAFDKGSNRLFIANSVANRLDIVNFANPAAPVLISSINLGVAPFNGAINSVDVFNGTVALALEGLTDKQANGKVVFTDINGNYISEAVAGAMPDMITFNHAGTKVYTANEGEPNAAYTVDPVGSITIVDISGGVASPSSSNIGFTAYNGQEATLRSQGIRIYGVKQPGNVASSAAEDFEPEYITISDDDTKAWVTLQENNALVELDLTNNSIVKLIPLGYKDHSLTANAMDVSDQTSGINLSNFNVRGMYEPDAITNYTSGGNIYLLTANEGDSRAYSGFSEETRVGSLTLDPTVYPNSADIKNNLVLGRLTVTNKLGDTDNDGDIDQIYCLGSRSFSIWNPATSSQVFDSKDDLERITANSPAYSQFFNMSNTIANTNVKNRSDDKGPESEGITTGKIGNKTYAFLGLERIGGVMVYDVTNPAAPVFVTYANSRTTSGGDRGTEGIFFIPANESPNGKGLVVLSNEISSTISTFEITPCAAPGIAAIANDGNTTTCLGSTVRLYNVNSNITYTYQWLKDGVAIAGAINSDYIATTSGAYSLVVFNAAGCVDTSAPITVTILPAATVDLSVSTNTASETAGTIVTVTATASAAVCVNETISLGVAGTGITAADYTLSNATITIPSGSTTGSVTFTVVSDNTVEPLETATLTISNPSSGIVLGTTTTQNIAISDFVFTLQVLHASDFEGAVEAVQDAPRFAAIVDQLEESYVNTIKLSSGDNYIPGPFLSSGGDPSLNSVYKTAYENFYNTTFTSSVNLAASIGRADISILNFIGIEASALGNHEFDLGTNEMRTMIAGANTSSATVTTWYGAQFPYLSSNLNFSGDTNLNSSTNPITVTDFLRLNTSFMSSPSETPAVVAAKRKLAPSTIVMKGGQKIGIVGCTTQVLASISSPGATTVVGGNSNNMAVLAGIVQPVVNALIADGCNKVILLSHLQQIAFEQDLATKLTGVDIIIAAGSNTLLADANDRLRAGDVAAGTYPFLATDLAGRTVPVVNTDGNYKYVGRLVVDFDSDGNLLPASINDAISGVYATDQQGLNDVWGANVGNAFLPGTRGYQVQLLCNAIGNVINSKDGNLFGKTSVFLEGRRNFVRTEETNLGNITSEANLWLAKFYDPATVISIKNGGGIRSAIGNVIAVGDNVTLVPPIANPGAGKQSGDISQLDIENSLRFNNQLSLMTLTASGLRAILEHAVNATTATSTPGQFAQVAGVRYSYNLSNASGSKILNAVITDSAGNVIDTLVVNGVTVGNLSRTFRVVTLNFLAGNGDGYPFVASSVPGSRVDLNTVPAQGPALASFANAGSEQDAFAEYMKSQFSTTPYGIADTPLVNDCRIQRVPARADNVLPPNAGTNGALSICTGTTLTTAQLFAALGGTPQTGGTWSPALAGAGVYTYTVTSPSCAGSASATVTVTDIPNVTPTVALTSSDGDNTFAYGTPVTFTAAEANIAGGSVASYDFRVNGNSVQNGASATYTVSNLSNGNQVSVVITVTGGTCLTTSTATSNTITNTVTGAFLTSITNYCGQTLPVIGTRIKCSVPSGVVGTLGYRFRVTNNVTSVTTTIDNSVASFDMTMISGFSYGTSYSIQVAAIVNGVLQPYSAVCVITTPTIPVNQPTTATCGQTLGALNSRIFASAVSGSQLYRWRVALSTAPTTYFYHTTTASSFRLTSVPGLNVAFGRSYLVSVQSDILINGVLTTSAYSAIPCVISTPSVSTISVSANQCGQTLNGILDGIFVNSVPNAVSYTYRVRKVGTTTDYDHMSSNTSFKLSDVVGLSLTHATQYNVSVSVKILIDGVNYESPFSTPCIITTPEFPSVSLQESQCSDGTDESGPYLVPSGTTSIFCDFVSGASYEFVLQKSVGGSPVGLPIVLPRSANFFNLSMVPGGLEAATVYIVSVRLIYYGTGPEGKDCVIKTPPASLPRAVASPFGALALPNPFANNFMITVTTESKATINIAVYDMVGRVLEQQEISAKTLESLPLGERYPSGVYNIVVTQGEDVKTLRVVKR